MMLNCRPNGRRWLERPLKRILDRPKQVSQGLTRDRRWWWWWLWLWLLRPYKTSTKVTMHYNSKQGCIAPKGRISPFWFKKRKRKLIICNRIINNQGNQKFSFTASWLIVITEFVCSSLFPPGKCISKTINEALEWSLHVISSPSFIIIVIFETTWAVQLRAIRCINYKSVNITLYVVPHVYI